MVEIEGEPLEHTGWHVQTPTEEQLDGLLLLEPRNEYDQCIIGVVERFNDRFVLYSKRCVIEQLDDPDANSDEILEFYHFNILGGWVGESTPGFLDDEDG